MYKLLVVTNQPEYAYLTNQPQDWETLGFQKPALARTADEAIEYMAKNNVDAIGYHLSSDQGVPLGAYLNDVRPSLPIFRLRKTWDKQLLALVDARAILSRTHSDFTDEQYDEAAVLDILRNEFTHSLLVGDVHTTGEIKSRLRLLRARFAAEQPFALLTLCLPQGDVYMSDRWHYGSERLEVALRNFFGREVDGLYYALAVRTTREIRLAAIQRTGVPPISEDEILDRADAHAAEVIEQIKEYLDLDIRVCGKCILPGLLSLAAESHADPASDGAAFA